MSQPKREPINRYRPLTQGEARALGGGLMRVPTEKEANKGDYVEYSEYQQLAADHAALVQQGIRDHQDWRSKLNFLEADYKAEIARLTAENERLRKVGFRLAERLSWCGNLGDNPLIEEWQQITGTDVYKDDEGGAK